MRRWMVVLALALLMLFMAPSPAQQGGGGGGQGGGGGSSSSVGNYTVDATGNILYQPSGGVIENASPTSNTTVAGGQDGASNSALGGVILRGGNQTGTGGSNSAAGGVDVIGGNNAGTSATSQAGSVEWEPGYSTAGGEQGLMIFGYQMTEGVGSTTQWYLQCYTSANAMTVNNCPANPVAFVGVTDYHSGSATEVHIPPSESPISASAPVTLYDTVCAGATAGQVTDSGGTGPCSAGQGFTVGRVIAVSGSWTLADGASFTASTTLPLVAMWGNGLAGSGDISSTISALSTAQLATPTNGASSTANSGGTLTGNTTYYYRVAANDTYGSTVPSTEKSQLTATGNNLNTITISWTPVANATSYSVYGRTTGAELLCATVGANTYSYTDTNGCTPAGSMPVANTTGQIVAKGVVTAPQFNVQSKSAGPQFELFDDFYSAAAVASLSIGSPTGQGVAADVTHTDVNHPGNILLTSGTGGTGTGLTAYEVVEIVSPNSALGWTWESALYVPVLPGTTAGAYQAGMANVPNAEPWTTGVGFWLSSASGVANDWYCRYSSTATDSTQAATVAWTRLTMVNDGTKLHWYINGSEVCGTGVAIGSLPAAAQYPAFTTTAKSATSMTMAVDYVTFQRAVTR